MKKSTLFSCLAFFFLSMNMAIAQSSPVGIWKTIDDETGEPKSHVEIFERDGKYFGKVIKLLPAATTTVCNDCPGDKNGASLIGLEILWDLKPYKDYWSYGEIVDPGSGKVYSANAWLENADELKVKGYIGISLIGRSQSWYRVK